MAEEQPKLNIVDVNSSDEFDMAQYRVSQNFLETTNVKKLLTTVPVRKPGAQDFIRVHSDVNYRDLVAILELKDDRESYLVNLAAVPELQNECYIATLFTAITRTACCSCGRCECPPPMGRSTTGTHRRHWPQSTQCADGCASAPT